MDVIGWTATLSSHVILREPTAMIHFYCDLCQRRIDEDETRFTVKLEAYPANDNLDADLEVEDDRDHLLEIHEALELRQDPQGQDLDEEVYVEMKFDLCPECHRRFIRNPLGRDLVQLHFSEN